MTSLWLGLLTIAATGHDEIAATLWYAWYRVRYSTIWEINVDSIPAPIQALLPYLKWVASLIVVVTTAAVTAGFALPAWAVLAAAVASSAGVFFASNNLGKPGVGTLWERNRFEGGNIPWKPWEEPHTRKDVGGPGTGEPYLNPLTDYPSTGPVTGVPASDISATAVPPA